MTIVEALDRIAPLEEPELSEWMTRILRDQGVEVVTSARVTRVDEEQKTVIAEVAGGERRFVAGEILVATGRRPVLDGLDLDTAGVKTDERGNLVLDDDLRTSNDKVFAAGDVTGAPQFVYVAAAQGTLAADNAISNAGRTMDYKALPRVTFTTPNIAAVGLTDEQARAAGYDCECRTLELGSPEPSSTSTGGARSRSSPNGEPARCWGSTPSPPTPATSSSPASMP